jgi:hypothetical protein
MHIRGNTKKTSFLWILLIIYKEYVYTLNNYIYVSKTRKMLNLQHQHNNHTTTPHMRVDPTHWGPPSCEGLLCGCCDGVVYESNPLKQLSALQMV